MSADFAVRRPQETGAGSDASTLTAAIQLVFVHAFVPAALRANFVLFLPSLEDQQLLLIGTTVPPADLPAGLRALADTLEREVRGY